MLYADQLKRVSRYTCDARKCAARLFGNETRPVSLCGVSFHFCTALCSRNSAGANNNFRGHLLSVAWSGCCGSALLPHLRPLASPSFHMNSSVLVAEVSFGSKKVGNAQE